MIRLLLVFLLVPLSSSHALNIPFRNGIRYPGFDTVSLSLAGLRTLSFEDPISMFTNPSIISSKFCNSMVSLSAGPVFTTSSFSYGDQEHSESATSPVYSMAMRFPVIEGLSLGIAVGRTAEIPFRRAYSIPDFGYGTTPDDTTGFMDIKGEFSEGDLGVAWDAADWLTIGFGVGSRFTSEEFHMTYTGATGTVTSLKIQNAELCFSGGVTAPLGRTVLAASWTSPGDYSYGISALGAKYMFSDRFSAGAEVERALLNERDINTGRLFATFKPSETLTLRCGVSYATETDEISREGLGVSAGAGYDFGILTVHGAYSRSSISGDYDAYGYQDLESYEGNSSIISLGITSPANGGN